MLRASGSSAQRILSLCKNKAAFLQASPGTLGMHPPWGKTITGQLWQTPLQSVPLGKPTLITTLLNGSKTPSKKPLLIFFLSQWLGSQQLPPTSTRHPCHAKSPGGGTEDVSLIRSL